MAEMMRRLAKGLEDDPELRELYRQEMEQEQERDLDLEQERRFQQQLMRDARRNLANAVKTANRQYMR